MGPNNPDQPTPPQPTPDSGASFQQTVGPIAGRGEFANTPPAGRGEGFKKFLTRFSRQPSTPAQPITTEQLAGVVSVMPGIAASHAENTLDQALQQPIKPSLAGFDPVGSVSAEPGIMPSQSISHDLPSGANVGFPQPIAPDSHPSIDADYPGAAFPKVEPAAPVSAPNPVLEATPPVPTPGAYEPNPSPSLEPTPSVIPTPTIEPSLMPSVSPMPTENPGPTLTPEPTLAPTPSPAPTETAKPTYTPEPTPSPTITPFPTETPTSPAPEAIVPQTSLQSKVDAWINPSVSQEGTGIAHMPEDISPEDIARVESLFKEFKVSDQKKTVLGVETVAGHRIAHVGLTDDTERRYSITVDLSANQTTQQPQG